VLLLTAVSEGMVASVTAGEALGVQAKAINTMIKREKRNLFISNNFNTKTFLSQKLNVGRLE
jgi:hypothetical protein